MSATTTNGKPARRQLADQLDRLDQLIDTLGEGLNGAVADAAREGVRLAVKEVVIELVSNPEFRALLTPAPVPTPATDAPPVSSVWSRVKSAAAACGNAATGTATRVKAASYRRAAAASAAVAAVGRATGESLPVRRVIVVGMGAGALVGAACVIAPHTVAAITAAVGGVVSVVAAQVGQWLVNAARRIGLLS